MFVNIYDDLFLFILFNYILLYNRKKRFAHIKKTRVNKFNAERKRGMNE